MSHFPFGAVVGQDEAKLALMLAAVEPAIGGVLLRGQEGSAKTTRARGLPDCWPIRHRSSSCRSAPPRTALSAPSTWPRR